MYAVIKTGGKQYRVTEGQYFHVEKLDAEEGASINFNEVLLVGEGENIQVGSPTIEGAVVTAKVLVQERGKKVKIIKFRRRKHHRKQMGHRQYLTKVEIVSISAS